MPKLIIRGQNKLSGEIAVRGAKNAALKIIPAALLSSQKITVSNLPDIEDVGKSLALVKNLGARVNRSGDVCEIEIKEPRTAELGDDLAGKLRASIMFAGPLLARTGEAVFPAPGGCLLASGAKRPIDLFLEGFAGMGAEIRLDNNRFRLKAARLKGCDYFFSTVSVTGTESMMLAAVLAEGTTPLKNCAMEPEIEALAGYLNSQGAKISGAGTPTMVIRGVKSIGAGDFRLIPDRIETGTFALLAAVTRSEIAITACDPAHIEIVLTILKKIGVRFKAGADWIKILPGGKIGPFNVKTHEYPGFPTDLQAPYTVLATQAGGSSLIHETIYDRRLMYVDMLMQMGADIIMCDPHRVVVNGPARLYGKKLTSPDLRAGIAMIIAGLVAEGETRIDNIYQIDRGYEDIEGRLRALGADIKRVVD